MAKYHRDASLAVAQVIFDRMSADDQEEVRKEAKIKGVAALDIVRSSLDILIKDTRMKSSDS